MKTNLDRGFKQSFNLLVFVEVSRFEELNDFFLYSMCLLDSIDNEQSLYTTSGQNKNDLQRVSVNHRLNTV